jgi:antitoxin component YwqK of YwqJK toxin-antitoxin module
MKNYSILLCLLISFTAFCQNKTDDKGRKQGPWEKTHPKSIALQYKGQFIDDKPVGTFYYYYPSKSLQATIKHDVSSNRSSAIFYSENGVILAKGIYKNMKKDSIWLNYAPSGRLSSSESYKEDKLNGPKIIYYLSEDLSNKSLIMASYTNYLNGLVDGEKVEYFDSGLIKLKGTYKNNKKIGVWDTNHPNGKLMLQERYKDGVLHGWSLAKDEAGTEISRKYYFHGELLEGKKLENVMKQFKEKGINPNN